MIAKLLAYLAEAEVAGIVMGAQVPIALTSRADKPLSRMVSCAIALLVARQQGSIVIWTGGQPMVPTILVINAGFSCVKFAAFQLRGILTSARAGG
jgi:hypothetical protein